MTGPIPDLAALREKAWDRRADPYERIARYEELDDALTALVDDLRAENERLREAVKLAAVDLAIVDYARGGDPAVQGIFHRLGEALTGSPADTKEQP